MIGNENCILYNRVCNRLQGKHIEPPTNYTKGFCQTMWCYVYIAEFGEGVLLWDPSGEANERFDQILLTDQLNVAIIKNHSELRKENLIFHHYKTRLQVSSETRKNIGGWEDFIYLPYSIGIESFIYFIMKNM